MRTTEQTVAMLEALAAGPKPFGARLTFSDGTVSDLWQPRAAMRDNHAARMREKIGRPFRLFDEALTEARYPTLVSVETMER